MCSGFTERAQLKDSLLSVRWKWQCLEGEQNLGWFEVGKQLGMNQSTWDLGSTKGWIRKPIGFCFVLVFLSFFLREINGSPKRLNLKAI